MSKLNTTDDRSVHTRAIQAIQGIISEGGSAHTGHAEDMIALEGLDTGALSGVRDDYNEVTRELRESVLGQEILAAVPEAQACIALEAAAMTIMVAGNPAKYHQAMAKKPNAPEGGVLVQPAVPGSDYSEDYSLEAFDPKSMDEFIAQSAYANAMAAIQGEFEETFFPTQVVPAGKDGVDIKIVIPKVFAGVTRSSDGTCVDFQKESIINALIDSSILDKESTKIVPHATDATNPVGLVPAAVVPNASPVIDGVAVDTRPILFGSKVDLLALSSHPSLIASGVMDETDSLDDTINIGEVYVSLDADGGAVAAQTGAVLKQDISGQIGALLTQTAEGSGRDYQSTFDGQVIISQGAAFVTANGAATLTELEGAMGLAAGTAFSIVLDVELSAKANIETGCMTVYANAISIAHVYDATGTEIDKAPIVAATDNIALVGYQPQARRTNSNLRTRGIIVDSTGSVTYRFPVPLGTPIISQQPIGEAVNTSTEGLAHTQRIRNNNNAVKAMLNMQSILQAGAGIPANNPAVGSEMVTPTIVEDTADVTALVATLSSKDSLDDLRGHLTAIVTNVANQLILKSGYLAALEFVTGNNKDFEVICVTDSHIASYLMESGDERTFGAGRNYVITQSLNSAIHGKIFISLRRSKRDDMSPLDFGAHLYTPTITHNVQVSRGTSTVSEIHTIPRNVHYVTLPVLGVVTVTDLDDIFVTAP